MSLRPKPVRTVLAFVALFCLVRGLSSSDPRDAFPRFNARFFDPFPFRRPAPPPGPGVPPPAEGWPESLAPIAAQLVQPETRQWKYIVLHHSAGPRGNAAIFDEEHKAQGWDGLGYHFVIGNGNGSPAGAIEVGFRWLQQREGAHAGKNAAEYNQHGIGICIVGNYEETGFPEEVYGSLRDLTVWLARRYRISSDRILPHSAVRGEPTLCPGKNFPLERLRRDVDAALSK